MKTGTNNTMKVKCVALSSDGSVVVGQSSTRSNGSSRVDNLAWVIDECLSDEFLALIHEVRHSLPLDAKRPTCKRRFFSAATECPTIIDGIKNAVETAISTSPWSVSIGSGGNEKRDNEQDSESFKTDEKEPSLDSLEEKNEIRAQDKKHSDCEEDSYCYVQAHVLAYMRFLEYDEVGGHLDPHTDGNKVCEDTGKRSTHTLLLYLSHCETGGETILFAANDSKSTHKKEKQNNLPAVLVEAVQPRVGRILLFPHATLHEGAATVDVPKICLRAEVCLY
jgi:hypothetical protein